MQLSDWLLSVFGGLLSFIAIFVALETFFLQDWLSVAGRAQNAYKEIGELRRPLTGDQQSILNRGLQRIQEAVDDYPKFMAIFLDVVSLSTLVVAASFCLFSSEIVSVPSLFFWSGMVVDWLVAAVVIALGLYSYSQQRGLMLALPKVKKFHENTSTVKLADVVL